MRRLHTAFGRVAAVLLVVWRRTCTYHVHADPRPALRARGRTYVYALLHAHQVAAVFINDDRRMAAMVSRSADGDLLVPVLRLRRVLPVRGSSRRGERDKGGRAALAALADVVRRGVPALLAVDGPRGPRGRVHRGVAVLARDTGAAVLPVAVVPSRRWILSRAWDRLQIPRPFSTITMRFAAPLDVAPDADVDATCARIAAALADLERRTDPEEAARLAGGGAPG